MQATTATRTDDEDFLRARFHGLLATLLSAPPTEELLTRLARLEGDSTPLGTALGELAETASRTSAAEAAQEFQDLFIGVGAGELFPYASWYLTGFLHEKPLAALRTDMARLGIEPSPGSAEPEDHAASLLEMMQGLITGLFGPALEFSGQKAFFDAHLGNWMPRFLSDLETAQSARFYVAVARLGRAFLDIETQAFAMGE